jgi:hypothetical protein
VTVAARRCGCDGSGSIPYERHEEYAPGEKDLGDGTYIGASHTYGTHLCSCRWKLKPRDGEARWWTSRTLMQESCAFAVFDETADVTVNVEVPVSADNYLVRTKGNRYWPTSVQLAVSSEEMNWLFPDEARKLAAMLNRAADLAEAFDAADADDCGHWAPCDCTERGGRPGEGTPP